MDKYSDLCKRMGIPSPTREHYADGGHVAHKERSEHHEKHHDKHEPKHREHKNMGGNAGQGMNNPIKSAIMGAMKRRAPMMTPSPEATMPMKKGGHAHKHMKVGGIADAIMGKKNHKFMDEGGMAKAQIGPKTKAGVPIRVAKSMPKPMAAVRGAVPMSAAKARSSVAMRKGGKCNRGEPE